MAHPICPFLRGRLKDYLGQKDQSIRWLSRQTKIDYAKLYRLEADELKSFSFFETRRLLKFIDPENYRDFLSEFYPEETRDLAADLGASDAEQEQKIEAIDIILKSTHNYEFYLFVAETPGANRGMIEKSYGTKGIELLNSFLEKGALSERPSGTFEGVLKGLLSLPEDQVKAICKTHVDLVDLGEPGSIGANYGKGLNLAGQQKAYAVIAKAWAEVLEIFENREYHGTAITVFSLFFGSSGGLKS
ncbi:MAG TPA: hypothetical protein VE954_41855 [Oligoflexus sp.]|uniref:hypothetical protein n=1 Tax=Oligoflexus sp. TaxID=1971216 RepID=UPI002D5E3773|nr:hypothetical protein [Oligoflexus sp.]HYX39688.1 hypothetical protein [Oligoflexus sp.]